MDKTTKTITLRRSLSQKGATNGILYMGYRRLCATLERTMRQLPEGNYQLRARRSKNKLKELLICPADLPLMAHRPKKPLGTICAGNEVNPQSWTQPLLFICKEQHFGALFR